MHQPEGRPVTELPIEPFQSVGPLTFGMTPADIAKHLGPPFHEAKPYFVYADVGLKVEVREGRCVFVESGLHRVVLTIHGIRLEGTIGHLVDQLARLGIRPTVHTGANEGAVDFLDIGVSIWCEDEEESPHIDTAAAWQHGYLDLPLLDR
jgi:hypothetical protein